MTATTRPASVSVSEPTLYVAFELGQKEWKVALTSGFGIEPVVRTIRARDLRAVERVLGEARTRLGLPRTARVESCYEAGRDGFWVHRALTQLGVVNRVVDSASIEVSRRTRRPKTDRLDALKLVRMLVRACYGEQRVWSEVHVPSVVDEAARQVSRERTALTEEKTRLTNQLRGWLTTWGATLPPAPTAGVVDDGVRLGRPDRAPGSASPIGAGGGPPGGARDTARRTRHAATGGGARRGAGESRAAAGAAERRGDDERVGAAR